MRGTVEGLPTAAPIGLTLPGLYQEDEFTQRFTGGLDDVLAPVLTTLDCLGAYVDPQLAPEDFLPWLAGWVGIAVDPDWPVGTQRALVARAIELFRLRGTAAGLREQVAVFTGGEVEVSDSGGVRWSTEPGGAPTGDGRPWVAVRLTTAETVSPQLLDALVAAAKPAHVVHEVEVRVR
jgi:phage tail-like protein